MPWIIGIDEAGYGPPLGPLVMTAVACRVPDGAADADGDAQAHLLAHLAAERAGYSLSWGVVGQVEIEIIQRRHLDRRKT